jgi:integrase
VISGTMAAAARWGWINSNTAEGARIPRPKPPEPSPPTPEQAARLVEAAFKMDPDWGTLVWLAMATGMRRGELCALRFSSIHFDEETIDLRRNWVDGKEKERGHPAIHGHGRPPRDRYPSPCTTPLLRN